MDEQRTEQPDEHHGTEGHGDAASHARATGQHGDAGVPGWDRPAVDPRLARRENESEDTTRVPEHAIEGGV